MPIVSSSYKAPRFFSNGHLQTIYPALFRYLLDPGYQRETLDTDDGDFIDIDWVRKDAKPTKLVILCHGLEGSSQGGYILGAINALRNYDFDILAMNYRGCSGRVNNLLKSYHSGKTEDLDLVIKYVLEICQYQEIHLVGFSVGGNKILKYLGERGDTVRSEIKKAVTFSVPINLEDCANELAKPTNIIYMRKFLVELHRKLKIKKKLYPGEICDKDYSQIRNFRDYDEHYTAPLNGFSSAQDYWSKASSGAFLSEIKVPTLLISALDDPFLGKLCYPFEIAENNDNLFLETPKHGGHVGFIDFGSKGLYYSDSRMLEFLLYDS